MIFDYYIIFLVSRFAVPPCRYRNVHSQRLSERDGRPWMKRWQGKTEWGFGGIVQTDPICAPLFVHPPPPPLHPFLILSSSVIAPVVPRRFTTITFLLNNKHLYGIKKNKYIYIPLHTYHLVRVKILKSPFVIGSCIWKKTFMKSL